MSRLVPLHTYDARCVRLMHDGSQIAAIADGETVVRWWNPLMLHGSRAAAIKRTSPTFPCVHRVVPVDPETCMPVGRPRWAISPPQKDWARYAIDYAAQALEETQEIVP